MTKRAKLSDRGPLLQSQGKGVDMFFEKTTPDDSRSEQNIISNGSPFKIEKEVREPLVKLIAYISPEQSKWIEEYAAIHGVSKARVVRHILDFFITTLNSETSST